MFLPRISQPSCSSGWLAASQAVYGLPGHEGHHVVIDVDNPTAFSERDAAVVQAVDTFLAQHGENEFPVGTVANTIFSQAIYEAHGSPAFYDVYIKQVFPRLKRSPRDWGRYFERMIAHPTPDGPQNLLADLVDEMKRNIAAQRTFRNIYELPIYNPINDRTGSPIGRQCLSFMSFKLDDNNRLLLSAVYRNHFYTQKLLGNLIGLGRLMAFVAEEAKLEPGALSVLSTHAKTDPAGASQAHLRALYAHCEKILSKSLNVHAA
jgi:hypothetical protein